MLYTFNGTNNTMIIIFMIIELKNIKSQFLRPQFGFRKKP